MKIELKEDFNVIEEGTQYELPQLKNKSWNATH